MVSQLQDHDGEAGAVRLIGRSISNAEACRIVGVDARTGNAGRGRTIISSSGALLRKTAKYLMRSAALGAC